MNSTSTVEVSIQAVSPVSRPVCWARVAVGRLIRPSGKAHRRARKLNFIGISSCDRRLQRVGTGLAGADAYRLLQVDDEDLAVADLAGVGGLDDGLDGALDQIVVQGHVDLHLGQ